MNTKNFVQVEIISVEFPIKPQNGVIPPTMLENILLRLKKKLNEFLYENPGWVPMDNPYPVGYKMCWTVMRQVTEVVPEPEEVTESD